MRPRRLNHITFSLLKPAIELKEIIINILTIPPFLVVFFLFELKKTGQKKRETRKAGHADFTQSITTAGGPHQNS